MNRMPEIDLPAPAATSSHRDPQLWPSVPFGQPRDFGASPGTAVMTCVMCAALAGLSLHELDVVAAVASPEG